VVEGFLVLALNRQLRFDDLGLKITAMVSWFGPQNQVGLKIDLGFETKPRNPRSLSPCARCRPHTVSSDLSIIRPPSLRPMLDHPRFSAPSLLLLSRSSSLPSMPHLSPTHHETSKHVSPHETDSKVEPPKFLAFKVKPRQVHYSSQNNVLTTWFLTLS
jgi:hypothetical protein